MRRNRLTFLLSASVFFCLALIFPNTILACSGPQPTLDGEINLSDYIVKGTIVEIDDANSAYIIEVQEYLKGQSQQQYLLVATYTRGYIEGLKENIFVTCSMGYGIGKKSIGKTAYFFLRESIAGSYSEIIRLTFEEEAISAHFRNEDGEEFDKELNESEFRDHILDTTKQAISAPDPTTPYPQLAVLQVKTLDGMYHFLPVDEYQLINLSPQEYVAVTNNYDFIFDRFPKCDISCFTASSNGIFFGLATKEDTIIINQFEYDGDSFLFSPSNDAVAIWNENQLNIYSLPGMRVYRYEDRFSSFKLNEYAMQVSKTSSSQFAAWSPDGRILAFSDAKGLWLWDAMRQGASPELLVPSSKTIPVARYFSPLGHYLAIENDNEGYNLDLISGEHFPDGLFSPDERNLIVFDKSSGTSRIQLCRIILDACEARGDFYHRIDTNDDEGFRVFVLNDDKQVKWKDKYSYFLFSCSTFEEYPYCAVGRVSLVYSFLSTTSIAQGIAFADEPVSETIATILNDYTITIDGKSIDLSEQLDSPIAEIQWLPSFFYQE